MCIHIRYFILIFASSLLVACSSPTVFPAHNISQQLYIPGLSPCDGNINNPLVVNSKLPLTILVHGCDASAGSFNKLSDVLALQEQQSVCFVYDDRDSLIRTAQALNNSITSIAKHLETPQITLLGHSQGGLISRKASTLPLNENITVDLVTVSAPLSGIKAAQYCGNPVIRVATLGIHDLVCWLISGDKWHEITDASDFIKRPGKLDHSIKSHLLIATDERNTCRIKDDYNQCIEDDYVFSLSEQVLPPVHNDLPVTKVKLKAGHVEIVGNENIVPYKLIKSLQDNGVIKAVEKTKRQTFHHKLQQIYKFTNVDQQSNQYLYTPPF